MPQLEEIDRNCALKVLGRIPDGLRDLTFRGRQLIKQLCTIELSDALQTVFTGIDVARDHDASSYEFDGISGYVDMGSPAELDDIFAGGGSIEAWISADSDGETDGGRILEKSNGNGWL
ncbi:MAG: hypothetical protein ACE5Q6_24565, partial [Dehalococcoidia bacterium]